MILSPIPGCKQSSTSTGKSTFSSYVELGDYGDIVDGECNLHTLEITHFVVLRVS